MPLPCNKPKYRNSISVHCPQVLGRRSPFPLILLPQFGGYWIEGTNHEPKEPPDTEQPPCSASHVKLETNSTAKIYRKNFMGKVRERDGMSLYQLLEWSRRQPGRLICLTFARLVLLCVFRNTLTTTPWTLLWATWSFPWSTTSLGIKSICAWCFGTVPMLFLHPGPGNQHLQWAL